MKRPIAHVIDLVDPASQRLQGLSVEEAHKLAGLADRSRQNLYPVDLEVLVNSADKLGLTQAKVTDALSLLRGGFGGAGL